jgi:hypothetical protein
VFSRGKAGEEDEEDMKKALDKAQKTVTKPGAELLTIEGQDEALPTAATDKN